MDIVLGLGVSFARRGLCSTISREGIARKFGMLGTVLLAAVFDGVLPEVDLAIMGWQLHMTFGALGCVWWMIHEMLSITEHAAILGMPLPKRLKDALAAVQRTFDEEPGDGRKPRYAPKKRGVPPPLPEHPRVLPPQPAHEDEREV